MKKKKTRKAARRPETDRPAKLYFKHLIIILSAGILVRLIYNVHLTHNIFLGNYILDSLVLHSWATDILAGKTANTAFFRAPLYPYLLALVYKMFGVSPWSAILFNNLLGLLTGFVSYLLAKRLFGPTVAFWAALVVIVYPTLIYFEGETMITTLAVFLFTLTTYWLLLAVGQTTVKNVVKAGLVLGLAAITRPTILPLAIIFPIAFLAKYGVGSLKDGLVKSLVLVAAVLVPVLPVTITNLVKGGEFVLISTQGGANFYIGNSEEADGITVVAPGPNLRIGPYNDNIWTSSMDEAERRAGQKLTQSEVSSFWFREAINDIRNDIGRAVELYLKKFYLFWHGQEIFNNKSLYYAGEYSLLMKATLWKKLVNFPSGILFPLMFVGVFLALRDKHDVLVPILYLLLFALVVSAFFVCARFRQPVIPIAVIMATYAVAALVRLYRDKRTHSFLAGVVLVASVIGLNWGGNVESRENLSQFYAAVGNAYLNKRDLPNAVTHLERSLEILPDNIGIYDMMGQALVLSGRLRDAEAIYLKGMEMFPTYAQFNFNLGKIHQMRGDFDTAMDYFHQAVESAPRFAPALFRLGYIFEQQQQLDSALYYFRRLDRVQPRDARLKAKIQSLQQALDSTE